MDTTAVLFAATLFLAFANGANDNVKGAATLLGSGTLSLRGALWYATAATFAGSLSGSLLAGGLLRTFTGKGLVPDEALGVAFLAAVGIGAAATVMTATVVGMPISTTHGLMGGLLGAGIASVGAGVELSVLGNAFVLPLIVSPLLSLVLAVILYPLLRWGRRRLKVERETCVCIGAEMVPAHVLALRHPGIDVTTGTLGECVERYRGRMFGLSAQTVLDRLHFITAGAVSFARGLNDTPKIVALLAGVQLVSVGWGSLLVGVAMAAGGLLAARKVARTMSFGITEMNHGQGFAANAVTAFLVIGASRLGVPVSTTHVSCGSLFGLGAVTGQARWGIIATILSAWLLTLPMAATTAWIAFQILN